MHKTLRTLSDTSQEKRWAGKTVLVRADFNVPLEQIQNKKNQSGHAQISYKIADDSRIRAAIPSLTLLMKKKCKIVLISHLGRPEPQPVTAFITNEQKPGKQKDSLELVSKKLSSLLNCKVHFCKTPIGPTKDQMVTNLQPGEVLLLENIRLVEEEKRKKITNNHRLFETELTKNIDIYVNEAFSVCHRNDTSIVGIPKHIPHFAGLDLEKEVETWTNLLTEPKKPFVMIVGGAKISDKVGAVQHLAEKADAVLVGGGTANNFLKAEGLEIYESYLEENNQKANFVKIAENLLDVNRTEKIVIDGFIPLPKINMPLDVVAAKSMDSSDSETEIIELTSSKIVGSREDVMFLDIGPKTAALYSEIISQAGTVFWNGPLGVFEKKPFQAGTKKVAEAVVKSKAYSIIGGGDTIAAINTFHLASGFDYISVAGGAALEFLSGKTLPGIAPLLVD